MKAPIILTREMCDLLALIAFGYEDQRAMLLHMLVTAANG